MDFDSSMFPSYFSVVELAVVVDSFDLFASHFLQSNFSVVLTLDSVVVLDVVVDITVVVLVVVVIVVIVVAFSVVVVVVVVVILGTLSVVNCHLSWF